MGSAAKKKVVPKSRAQVVADERQRAVVDKASKMTAENVLKSFTMLKLSMTDSVDQISNKLASSVAELKEVNAAIEVQKAELEALHNIKVEADTLQAIKVQQEQTRDDFHKEMTE